MKNYIYVITFIFLLISGCSAPIAEPVGVAPAHKRIDFMSDVKPILDRRCVVCHSCYNSPCQLKLSSYEGLDRGATKALVYDGARLSATEPTRLFMDALSRQAWREKGFSSVTQNSAESGKNNAILLQLLHHKKEHNVSVGEYRPDTEELTCPKDRQELADFLDDNPNKGMPYGFPALSNREYTTIAQWLAQGAHGPTPEDKMKQYRPSSQLLSSLKTWETFLNNDSIKHQMSARYLYEHLFLAHLYFSQKPDEFYELIRSTTPPGEPIKVIPTVRPYDDPGVRRVYYRFRKIHSTIVHKTHMTVALNQEVLSRYQELFIDTPWEQTPHLMAYDNKTASNAFVTFAQIPARSRYQFLLDNAEYVIRTFIRGPVCKGQIALNVIHDHFWVMFLDPDADKTILDNGFLSSEYENLRIPNEKGSGSSLYRVLGNRYTKRLKQFHSDKQQLYKETPAQQRDLWLGDKPEDAPILTVYRHFDSASVHRGVLGDLPRTAWVIDYPDR
ncbi:MAG TPA: peptidylprolyl isomerase, partial [Helicobacteraceae bacterium]|nr:peptidylprolyl isomerase [Helicobacteraceae bacterium]